MPCCLLTNTPTRLGVPYSSCPNSAACILENACVYDCQDRPRKVEATSFCTTCDDQELCSLQSRCMKGNVVTASGYPTYPGCPTTRTCSEMGCRGNGCKPEKNEPQD